MSFWRKIKELRWLWEIIGGFYLLAYLYWYIPALESLPTSFLNPPQPFPWHWTLDFVATGLTGVILLILGFSRARNLNRGRE